MTEMIITNIDSNQSFAPIVMYMYNVQINRQDIILAHIYDFY